MRYRTFALVILSFGLAGGSALVGCGLDASTAAGGPARVIADPVVDAPIASAAGEQTVVVSGGCFWGVQAVFTHVKGVKSATCGYSGGAAQTAHYDQVSEGTTGHAESVEITFDPSQVTFGQLLKVFFAVAHDPTERDRQGPDVGTQYRSAIFTTSDEQRRIAEAYIRQLNEAGTFSGPIVTEVRPLTAFYAAEDYHQNYAERHPESSYIRAYDLPKVATLERQYPDLYRGK